jgi:hypothetical protein
MSLRITVSVVFLFSIAMGFMESSVVIYLRELYYPGGFTFPLKVIPPNIASVEILRELSTLIMLVAIGWVAGKNSAQRFIFFLFSFAVWDLCYYIFLKLFLDWPASLFTWDILFLIPVPWLGPVIAPCILDVSMIALLMLVLYYEKKNIEFKFYKTDWYLLISGSLIVILSFVWDFLVIIFSAEKKKNSSDYLSEFSGYIPQHFMWAIFITGEILILISLLSLFIKMKNKSAYRKLI